MNLSCRAKNNKFQIKHLAMDKRLQSMLKSAVIFTSLCLLWCNGSVIASTVFADPTHLDPSIPTPASVIGHSTDEKAVRYEPLVRYLHKLADVSDRVILTTYGQTHEGRTLYYLTITSKNNQKRLAEIEASNAKLADPRKFKSPQEAQRLLDKHPAVAWMGYSIHGDELSSTDAAMYVAYQLAAGKDKATCELLDNVVVNIDPLMNPDGRERFLGQVEQLNGVVGTSDYQAMQHQGLWSAGRGNHYLYDMNRDLLLQSQPETQGRIKAILSWNPHLLVDSHEMGGLNTYLMDPPREPINAHYSADNLLWRARFSTDQSAAFNNYGWSYYTRDWYSDLSPIYMNSWANLLGTIGLLYEQAGVNAASVKQPTGQILTYRQSVHHQIVSSRANLQTLCDNRREILSDFLADRQWAVSSEGPHNEILMLPPEQDRARISSFVELLGKQGIEYVKANGPVQAEKLTDIWGNQIESKELSAGTLIIRSNQPHRRLLHSILKFDSRLKDSFLFEERCDLENHRGTRFYDTSAWNIPMALGLQTYWAQSIAETRVTSAPQPSTTTVDFGRKSGYGYLIDFSNSNIYPALVQLFDRQCHPRIGTKQFRFDGKSYSRGTVLLRSHENPNQLNEILEKIADTFEMDILPVDTARVEEGPDLGGDKFTLLHKPRVVLASQWPISSTSFGSVWYLLDNRLQMQTSPINIQHIGSIDLRKYNVLILPNCSRLSSVLNDGVIEKIKKWVENGGTLIAMGGSAAFVAQEKHELSAVRLKRNVLEQLEIYKEAIQREKDARNIQVDPNEIWGTRQPETEGRSTVKSSNQVGNDKDEKYGEPKEEINTNTDSKIDVKKLERTDQWQRLFSPTGVFVTGILDPEHWLCFGLDEKLPLLFWGDEAFMSKYPIATAVRLAQPDQLRLSGLLWPEAKERLADTTYATTESLGKGQVILFAVDPTFRSWTAGTERLFLNAVLLGPGMGSSPPLPW